MADKQQQQATHPPTHPPTYPPPVETPDYAMPGGAPIAPVYPHQGDGGMPGGAVGVGTTPGGGSDPGTYPPSAPPPDYHEATQHPAPTYTHHQPPPQPAYPAQQPGNPAQQPGYPVQQFAPAPPLGTYAQPPGYPMGGTGAPGYGPPPPPATGMTTVVIQHRSPSYGPHPISVMCPKCQAQITTNTDTKVGNMAWMAVGGIILFGMFIFPLVLLGCCFIPLCIPSLKDVVHSCPNCHQVVGHYNRGGRL